LKKRTVALPSWAVAFHVATNEKELLRCTLCFNGHSCSGYPVQKRVSRQVLLSFIDGTRESGRVWIPAETLLSFSTENVKLGFLTFPQYTAFLSAVLTRS
jgi:hypothetical protein